MTDRPQFFDDLAGVAGGAFSALAGLRDEAESMVRARVDETIRKLDLVKREDLDAVQEMAANARAGQEAAVSRLAALEARLAALEARVEERGTGAAPPSVASAATPTPELRPVDTPDNPSEVAPATLPPPDARPEDVSTRTRASHPHMPTPELRPVNTPATLPPGSGAPGSFPTS